jgi:hypothetical protein
MSRRSLASRLEKGFVEHLSVGVADERAAHGDALTLPPERVAALRPRR